MSLKVDNLVKSYGQGDSKISILKGVSLGISKGEIVAVVGPSGSGKSTLLSLLSGLDQADSGNIEINGNNIATLTSSELTRYRGRNIGIVFQQYHLMPYLTALENVALPLQIAGSEKAKELAEAYLASVMLSHRLNHLPSELSGGECQRVAIARALVIKPSLLLADEPSGSLDTATGNTVMELFFKVARENQITTIVVTHSESVAANCDRIIHLEGGQIK